MLKLIILLTVPILCAGANTAKAGDIFGGKIVPKARPSNVTVCYVGFDVVETYIAITTENILYSGSCVKVPKGAVMLQTLRNELRSSPKLEEGQCAPPHGFDPGNVRLYLSEEGKKSLWADLNGRLVGRWGCHQLSQGLKQRVSMLLHRILKAYPAIGHQQANAH